MSHSLKLALISLSYLPRLCGFAGFKGALEATVCQGGSIGRVRITGIPDIMCVLSS